jgi:tetratricopeptide (TPR) repeat protein
VSYELFLDKVDSGNRACVIRSGANRYEPAIYEHYLPAAPGKSQSPAFATRCTASEFGQRAISARRDGSKVKRALDRLTPNCADVVYRSCWSSPDPDPSARLLEAQREAQRNREAGEIYYRNRNYRGSESRFREALRYEPADPVATFELAQSLEKLGKSAEARDAYQAYLRILPNGPSAAGAQKAVKRLPGPSSSGNGKTL